jgi:superfamily II DNA or RNA helicase
MELDITNFLIKYPNIDQFDEDILNPYEEDFYESVYKKKEFYDIRLEELEKVPDKAGSLMNHQKLISRFFSSNTLYDELLLLHEMGSGKTCTAIGAVEQIRKEGKFQGALYLAKGDALVNNFINELVFKCTDGQYIPERYNELSDLQKVHRTRKAIEDYYKTNTFETFAQRIKKHETKDALSKWCEYEKFNNSVIIIDEVHNLRMKAQVEEDGKKINLDVYKEFYRFLHTVKDCKILLMSGTPMKDGVDEIASVMNLILPSDKQLPSGAAFTTEFFDEKNDILMVKDSHVDTLKKAFKGRVSYLKSMRSTVEKLFQENGDINDTLDHMVVYEDNMSAFQSEHYKKAYNDDRDGKEKGVWANSRQASLFVFPDGSIGKEGFARYVSKTAVKSLTGEKTKHIFSLSESLKNEILGSSKTESLERLKKFSSKYAESIKTILDAQRDGKSVFVYNEFVTGSGLILFGLILELFEFSKANGMEAENSKNSRYATLTSQTSTDKQIGMLVNRFNQPDNITGKIINVIIGSRKISEGFTFKNVQIIDIHTPWFNYSETSQVIARGHRLGSHKDLIEAGLNPQVAIYQRVSVPNNGVESIDFKMYKTSEEKDVSIKLVERIMKESAWDCSLSYKRNFVTDLDGKRECDYTDCDYVCDGVSDESPDELDYSSFYTQYDGSNNKIIIDDIIDLFRKNFKIDFDTLTNVYFKEFSSFEVLSALRVIINESRPIINKYGFVSYLKENNNIFFLSDSLSASSTEYYTENFHAKTQTSFDKILNRLYTESVPSIINLIKECKNLEDVRKIMVRLSNKIQEQFIESSIQRIHIGPDDPDNNEIKICNLILKYFKNSWTQVDNMTISKHLDDDTLRCFDSNDGIWKDCEDKYYDIEDKIKIDRKEFLESSPFGYYGLYNATNNLFCLRRIPPKTEEVVKGHKQTSGKVCTSYDHSILIPLAIDVFKLPFPKPEDIEKIQAEIHDKVPEGDRSMQKMINKCREILRMDKEDLKTEMKRDKIKKHLLTIKIPKDASDNELRRIIFWADLTKKDMCSYMHIWLKNQDYYDENDKTCGASDKVKPK